MSYAPEDANVPVTITMADYYEAIREAQEEAWNKGWDDGAGWPQRDINPYTPEANR